MSRPGAANTTAIVGAAAACALILALIAGVAMARSRAGLVLAMAAILALAALTYVSLAPTRSDQAVNRGWLTTPGSQKMSVVR